VFKEHKWSIIVHGGAKNIEPSEEHENREGVLWALAQGVAVLREGGTAADAVEQSIRAMEESGVFNAGYGSVPNAEDVIEMDASIMDGKTLDIGSVAGVRTIEHPISAARALLKEEEILLVGPEADTFARKKGLSRRDEKRRNRVQEASHDTVGAVARDTEGNIVVGLSTGGLKGTLPGRVGDVPLPGCGFYADNECGGVCMSGDGERIARITFAAEVVRSMKEMDVAKAVEESFSHMRRIKGEAGCIAIDKEGKIAWHHNSPYFVIAYQSSDDLKPTTHFRKGEG
jgi:beta-aspartyl-peptidase (threonine type)